MKKRTKYSFIFCLLVLVLLSCKTSKQEQHKKRLELAGQLQALNVATKDVNRVIWRLDSLKYKIIRFDTLGRVKETIELERGTQTKSEEQTKASDTHEAVGGIKANDQDETQINQKSDTSLAPPKAFWWVLGAVLLLILLAFLLRLLKK